MSPPVGGAWSPTISTHKLAHRYHDLHRKQPGNFTSVQSSYLRPRMNLPDGHALRRLVRSPVLPALTPPEAGDGGVCPAPAGRVLGTERRRGQGRLSGQREHPRCRASCDSLPRGALPSGGQHAWAGAVTVGTWSEAAWGTWRHSSSSHLSTPSSPGTVLCRGSCRACETALQENQWPKPRHVGQFCV